MIKKIKTISIIVALALIILACQKLRDDAVYPRILLEGNNPMKLITGCEWVEPGVSVIDDKPGVKLFTTGTPNTNVPGRYYVDYNAIDSDSNQIATRRVVDIGPLEHNDVVAEYQATDIIGPNDSIIYYESTISVFSSSPLILKIKKLGDSLTAFFTFDSTGYLKVNYDANDTLIEGTGQFSCDKTNFNLNYYHIINNMVLQHEATFTKK